MRVDPEHARGDGQGEGILHDVVGRARWDVDGERGQAELEELALRRPVREVETDQGRDPLRPADRLQMELHHHVRAGRQRPRQAER